MLRVADLQKIYFCTGARNHDLLKIFSHERIQFEYDERMASFKALGFAKGLNSPAAICTTSGTAVSECVSALLEAKYADAPLVSTDYIGNPHSCVFDPEFTQVVGDKMAKVIGWYDNEWGYSNRLAELTHMVAERLPVTA